MDISKLAPAPWESRRDKSGDLWIVCPDSDASLQDESHVEFFVLARNAFDVMMRRGWYPERCGSVKDGTWRIAKVFKYLSYECEEWEQFTANEWPDQFTALVEADKFLSEIEKTNVC